MSSPFSEYPKWVRSNGREAIVNDAEAEAAQFMTWDAEDMMPNGGGVKHVNLAAPVANALLKQPVDFEYDTGRAFGSATFDHDGDGKPGGSTAPVEDVADLRKTYQAKFGKRAFPGWKADELKARIEAA